MDRNVMRTKCHGFSSLLPTLGSMVELLAFVETFMNVSLKVSFRKFVNNDSGLPLPIKNGSEISVDEKWFVRQQQCIPRISRQQKKKLHQITHHTQNPFTHTHTQFIYFFISLFLLLSSPSGFMELVSTISIPMYCIINFSFRFYLLFFLLNALSNCFTSVCSFLLLLCIYCFFFSLYNHYFFVLLSHCITLFGNCKRSKKKRG